MPPSPENTRSGVNLRPGLPAARLVLFLCLSAFIYWKAIDLAPGAWLRPHVRMELRTNEKGRSQVFFKQTDGWSEENSRFIDIRRTPGYQTLHYDSRNHRLPEALRFDPLNSKDATIAIRDVEFRSPMGFRSIPLEPDDFRGEVGLEMEPASDGNGLLIRTLADDSWVYIKHDFSLSGFWLALPFIVLAIGSLALAALLIATFFPSETRLNTLPTQILILVHFLFLLLFFLTPTRRIDASWYFPTVWFLGAVLLLMPGNWKGALQRLKGNITFLIVSGFVIYFGTWLALTQPSDPVETAPRSEVLHTLAFMGFNGLVLAVVGHQITRQSIRLQLLIRIIVLTATAAALVTMLRYYSVPGFYFPDERIEYAYNPLFRALVGSAGYAIVLSAGLATWPEFKLKNLPWHILLAVSAIALSIFVVQCMSRAVIYPLALSAFGITGAHLLSRNFGPASASALTGLFVLFWALSPVPSRLIPTPEHRDQAFKREFITEFDSAQDVLEWEEEALGGRQRMSAGFHVRPLIWKAYLKESVKKPIFGHGFGGMQTVLVSKTGKDEDAHPTSTHNLYLSSFYFGGAIGFVLMTGMVISVFAVSTVRYLKSGLLQDIIPAGMATVSGLLVAAECVILAGDKGNVFCWEPNGYWFVIWALLMVGILQQAQPVMRRSAE